MASPRRKPLRDRYGRFVSRDASKRRRLTKPGGRGTYKPAPVRAKRRRSRPRPPAQTTGEQLRRATSGRKIRQWDQIPYPHADTIHTHWDADVSTVEKLRRLTKRFPRRNITIKMLYQDESGILKWGSHKHVSTDETSLAVRMFDEFVNRYSSVATPQDIRVDIWASSARWAEMGGLPVIDSDLTE